MFGDPVASFPEERLTSSLPLFLQDLLLVMSSSYLAFRISARTAVMFPELGGSVLGCIDALLFLMLLGLRVEGQEPTPIARLLASLAGHSLALGLVCWPSVRIGQTMQRYTDPTFDPPHGRTH